MEQTYCDGSVAEPQPDEFKLRKLRVNLGNAFVRLAVRDRLKVMRSLNQFTFGNTGAVSYRDPWSKDDMKAAICSCNQSRKRWPMTSVVGLPCI
jgi:hypothetical protein